MIPRGSIQPYSTGASIVYVGFYNQGSFQGPYCFGTCEGYPRHERRPDYMQVMNDVSGRKKPLDMSYQGQDATISLDMTVWDEGVAQMLQQLPNMGNLAGTPGTSRFVDRGALMGFEGNAACIWIAYGNKIATKAAYAGLPFGYRYPLCIPFAPDTTEEGAQALIRNMQFYAWEKHNFQAGTSTLYDNDMTAILGVPLNGPVVA
jgi:hypothetical protein